MIEEIRERWSKALSGPWLVDDDNPQYVLKPDNPGSTWDGTVVAELPSDEFGLVDYPTAEAIAHAPEDIATLLNEIDRLTNTHD